MCSVLCLIPIVIDTGTVFFNEKSDQKSILCTNKVRVIQFARLARIPSIFCPKTFMFLLFFRERGKKIVTFLNFRKFIYYIII